MKATVGECPSCSDGTRKQLQFAFVAENTPSLPGAQAASARRLESQTLLNGCGMLRPLSVLVLVLVLVLQCSSAGKMLKLAATAALLGGGRHSFLPMPLPIPYYETKHCPYHVPVPVPYPVHHHGHSTSHHSHLGHVTTTVAHGYHGHGHYGHGRYGHSGRGSGHYS